MSHATTYPQPPPAAYSNSQHPPHFDDEDVKTPYDDLIDQYAQPFRQNAQHKSFTLDSSLNGAPLSHKKTNLSDATSKELDAGTSEGADWCYPPGPAKGEKKEKGNWWSEVRPLYSLHMPSFTLCPRSFPTR